MANVVRVSGPICLLFGEDRLEVGLLQSCDRNIDQVAVIRIEIRVVGFIVTLEAGDTIYCEFVAWVTGSKDLDRFTTYLGDSAGNHSAGKQFIDGCLGSEDHVGDTIMASDAVH